MFKTKKEKGYLAKNEVVELRHIIAQKLINKETDIKKLKKLLGG